VIITADHYRRPEAWRNGTAWTQEENAAMAANKDHRVPLMIKLAGQKAGYSYDQTFNTVLLRNLIGVILRHQVIDPAGVATWLDTNKKDGESPYRNE
jgi:hypothetical protein